MDGQLLTINYGGRSWGKYNLMEKWVKATITKFGQKLMNTIYAWKTLKEMGTCM